LRCSAYIIKYTLYSNGFRYLCYKSVSY